MTTCQFSCSADVHLVHLISTIQYYLLVNMTFNKTTSHSKGQNSALSPNSVLRYLKTNPQFLNNYIVSNSVSKETFQRWTIARTGKERQKGDNSRKNKLVNEHSAGNDADWMEMNEFVKDDDGTVRHAKKTRNINSHAALVIFVRKNGQSVRNDSMQKFHTDRYPRGIMYTPHVIKAILSGVLELYRLPGKSYFTKHEEQIVNTLTTWGCLLTHFSQLLPLSPNGEIFVTINRQQKLNDFLLTVAKSIFQDIVSMDTVIMKVMNFAQKLVNADRASLFLLDGRTKELYARIFDVGTGIKEYEQLNADGQKEIRFPMDRGIAGHVASTGQSLNIDNAYDDPRFNNEVDLKTGYTTVTILCMPIFIRGCVIGVVEMVNKHNGRFTRMDEDAFEAFAIYCGLALHYAKLYDVIRRSEQKYKVAIEVLAYHSLCAKDEVNKLKMYQQGEHESQLESFSLNALELSELEKPFYAVRMFIDLFGLQRFDQNDLIRFVLTVRKNYRQVPYHNWTHGWSVAHAMFVILKDADLFKPLERLALFVACLCHDLDHRGKNNAYMRNMATPLAAIYSTSVMEHHHFNQTIIILQQDGHNIFKSLTSDEYKQVLSKIKHCILATDLALFFPNKAKMLKIIETTGMNWEDNDHRLLALAILMTSCDLISSTKRWEVQAETGDAERKNGRKPIPMMDRQNEDGLPRMQFGFMNSICVPCYELLAQLLPATVPLAAQCRRNMIKWQELVDSQQSFRHCPSKYPSK